MYFFNLGFPFFKKCGLTERSNQVRKNIIVSFVLKGLSIIIGLLLVPLSLNCLNTTNFGVWMTLTSVIAWISFFDVGIANGLRNLLSESLACKNYKVARTYVSTTYAIMLLIVAALIIVFIILNGFVDWTLVFNVTTSENDDFKKLVSIVFIFFGIRFVLSIISIIYIADQRPMYAGLFEVIGNAAVLFLVWLLVVYNASSLLLFGFISVALPVLVFLIASIMAFRGRYKFLSPSFSQIDFSCSGSLVGLGVKFFVVQIAALIIFQTSSIIIAQLFSSDEVAKYNVIFKYFNIVTMLWGIMMTPFWSAFTQAYILKDYDWIKKVVRRLNMLMVFCVLFTVLLGLLSKKALDLWTSGKIATSNALIVTFVIYTILSVWNNIYAYLLNGINKIKVQMATSIFASILHIPMAFFFVRYLKMGSEGIVLSMAISLSLFAVAGPIQTYYIFKKWKS